MTLESAIEQVEAILEQEPLPADWEQQFDAILEALEPMDRPIIEPYYEVAMGSQLRDL